MARTAFNAAIVYSGATYTVPGGKYAVANVFPGSNFFSGIDVGLILSLNSVLFATSAQNPGSRIGPLALAAGDVLANAGGFGPDAAGPSPTRSSSAKGTVCGFLFDTSTVKVPFSSYLIPGSASYTVPAGKVAVFNAFCGVALSGQLDPDYVRINAVNVANIRSQLDSPPPTSPSLTLPGIAGPLTANAGDVVDATASGTSTGVLINGFLYPA